MTPQEYGELVNGTATKEEARIELVQITITRAEGLHELCGIEEVFTSVADAEAWLEISADTCPNTGGYDKHDFTIATNNSEFHYAGRIDLKKCHIAGYSIQYHVLSFIDWILDQPITEEFSAEVREERGIFARILAS